jgi:hypothetical protein
MLETPVWLSHIGTVGAREGSNKRLNSVVLHFGETFYGMAMAPMSLTVLFAVVPIPHVMLSLILDRSLRVSRPSEVND